MNFRRIILSLAAISVLAGCATFEQDKKIVRRVEQDDVTATSLAKAAKAQRPHVEREAVVFHEGSWTSLVPIEIKQREARASLLCKGMNEVDYGPRSPVDILEFSQFITNLCGVPIRVMPDAITAIQSQGRLSVMGATGGIGGMGGMTSPPIPSVGQPMSSPGIPPVIGAGQGYNTSIGGRSGQIDIKYSGNLPGLLDMVTNRLGVSWKVVDGAVNIFYLDTRTFRLFSQPYAYDVQTIVQSGSTTTTGATGGASSTGSTSGGISGSSGSQQSTTISMKSKRWDDIDLTIKQMLTPGVGRSQASSSTGTYTVTDIPEVLDRVAAYLDTENKSLTKQIIFNVKVLTVTLTDSNGFGIDWSLVYKTLNGNFGFNLTNVTNPDASAISGKLSVLSTATGNAAQFAGTSAVISALAQQGRVSELMSPTLTTLNHHTVPIQLGSQISYLAGSQTTNTAQVGSTTSTTIGTITTGFNMRLTPYVMPDNQMLLDVALNISSLRQLRQVGTASSPAEAPDLDNRIFNQTARLRAGETLILSGVEQVSENSTKNGVNDPSNVLLGGSIKNGTTRSVAVILISPILMD